MRIKNTKVWKKSRDLYYKFLLLRNYKKSKHMRKKKYESYLIKRYEDFMNRREYTKGKTLSFENPLTFSEKSQWIKLYDQDPRKPIYSDKYAVRKHIEEVLGPDYLVPLIVIDGNEYYMNAKEIDFDKLPNSFVIKCTHGSHMNIIVKDKTKLTKKDIKAIKIKLNKWLRIDYVFYVSLETQYTGIKPRIIIEKYLDEMEGVRDYKFLCFGGRSPFFWVNENASESNGKEHTTTTFMRNGLIADFNMNMNYAKNISNYSLPDNLNSMIKIAEELSEDFICVRVDLYNIKGRILFGEMTFNSAAGYDVPNPVEYDLELGKYMKIDRNKRIGNYTYRQYEKN